MPLYIFKCPKGHQFEQIVPYDTETTGCPKCAEGRRLTVATRDSNVELPVRRNPAYGLQR